MIATDQFLDDGSGKVDLCVKDLQKDYQVGLTAPGDPFLFPKVMSNSLAIAIGSRAFDRLARQVALQRQIYLKSRDVQEIADILYSMAAVSDKPLQVHLRIAAGATPDEAVIDLGTQDLTRAILADGIVSLVGHGSPVLFHRPESMQALPRPAEAGDWRCLLPFVNVSPEHSLILVAWMAYLLTHPKSAQVTYPILWLVGESGTGKSTLCRIIRALIDPNSADVQLMSRNPGDIAVSMRSQYLVIFDNLRNLSDPLSDTLCVVSTGGTLAGRKLYTDAEEHQTRVHGPLILNSIHPIVRQEDLASRTIPLYLQRITPGQRASEDTLLAEFRTKAPSIFYGLLNLAAQGLKNRPSAKIVRSTRVATFSRWLAAVELPMGQSPGYLQELYSEIIRRGRYDTIAENPLAMAILSLARRSGKTGWNGTPTMLLKALEQEIESEYRSRANWPANPNAMSKRLKALLQLLEEQGVFLEFRHTTTREIGVRYLPEKKAGAALDEPDGLDDPQGSAERLRPDL